jgi:hypothetical protein
MLSHIFNSLIKNVNKNQIKQKLAELDYIEKDSHGNIKAVKSINNHSFRGLTFIPSSWEEKNVEHDCQDNVF